MPQIDDVNGLLYMAARWIAHASLISERELISLRAGLLMLSRDSYDENDAQAYRMLCAALKPYMEKEDAAD